MQKEVWKPVKGYEGRYEVSSIGRVRNRYGKVLSADERNGTGYMYVILRDGKKGFHANIHRLVAQAFIPNPLNLPIINHINEVRNDNRVENLEWCNQSYNTLSSTKFQKRFKKIIQKDKKGNIIAIYESIHVAARALNNNGAATAICKCARVRAGIKKGYKKITAYGYIWEYKN